MFDLSKEYDAIVVGGGPAGMFCAGIAAQNNKKVLILEKNNCLGKKLLITGKGRCNITNISSIKDFVKNFGENGKFLYQAFSRFFNSELISFFEERGLKTKVERGGRVFPINDDSQKVLDILKNFLEEQKVNIKYNSKVQKVNLKGDIKEVVLSEGEKFFSRNLVLATGGCSYPLTGSTGDGYEIAKQLGHSITPLRAGLVPLETSGEIPKQLQGLSLKNVRATILYENRNIASEFGEMLFTHFGVSGPIILKLSNYVVDILEGNKPGKIFLSIDLKPALSEEQLKLRLIREFTSYGKKNFSNVITNLLPKKLVNVFITLCGVNKEKKCNQITSEEINKIISLLKNFRLEVISSRPISEAIITRGGVNLKEINPYTMESKIVKGLFFCGEILDVNGPTGGFNLQMCFSTGFLAGKNII